MELREYLKNLPINKERIELCYLWISNYKLIDNQGFNFGAKYIFDYDCENKVINIKENSNYIKNFFGENIINITAIVGENGAGKSFILGNLNKFLFSSEINHITIFLKNEKLIIIDNNEIGSININDILVQKNYELKNIKFKQYNEYIIKEHLGIIYSIFYSNVFYNSIEKSSISTYQKNSNISTKFLLSFEMNKDNLNQAQKLYQHDMLLMIQFLNRHNDKIDKLFRQPIKYLNLQVINNYENGLKAAKNRNGIFSNRHVFSDSRLIEDSKKKELERFIMVRDSILHKLNNSVNNKNRFKLTTIINILYDFYKGIESLTNFKINISKLPGYGFDYSGEIDINILIKDIKRLFNEILTYIENNLESEDLKDKGLEIKNYISFIDILDELENIAIYNNDVLTIRLKNNIRIKLKKKIEIKKLEKNTKIKYKIGILNKFIRVYYCTSQRNYYIFEWIQNLGLDRRVLSSGEEAMLKMYSRIYSLLAETYNNLIVKIDNNCKNLFVLIDEPEVYLHPEWQRKLIDNLINYFKEIYNEYNVQLVLTSNTPFLLSDLPRENIILLQKEKIEDSNENTRYSKKNNYEYKIKVENDLLGRSFGQNIHTLLKESFFMKSTIGEYSKNKINQLILALKPLRKENNDKIIYPTMNQILEKLNLKNINDVEKLIELIGEPIIRKKLIEMLEVCILHDSKELYKRRIKEKMKELQNKFEAIDRE